jgi:hypothetical protein
VRVSIVWPALFSVASVISCRASVNADANVSGDGSANASADGEVQDFDKPLEPSERKALIEDQSSGELPTLSSARQDLALAAQNGAQCRCLAAAIGDPKNSAFRWTGTPPSIDTNTQLAVAFTSSGVACTGEPKDSLGASYWGYRITGNDVVVFVEGARAGRPRTEGAIIPKPVAGGQVFIAPINKKLPYGQATDGTARCKLGNVGPERTTGFAPEETGGLNEASVDTTQD